MAPALPTPVLGIQVNSTVCSVSIVRQPPAVAVEGRAFAVPPLVRVVDRNGAPVPGKVRDGGWPHVC
jgi:hypothetical protein